MSVRLAHSRDAPVGEEKVIAVVRDGPWSAREVRLAPPAAVEAYPHEAWFPGLEVPRGSQFFPAPCSIPGRRDVYYLVGASGSGKSTMARELAAEFVRANPDSPVWIICPDDSRVDPAYAGLAHAWISPDVLCEGTVTMEDLKDGKDRFFVILDDTEAAMGKKHTRALEEFSQMLLERGRKAGAHVVYIAHRGAAGRASKVILAEMTAVWLPIEAAASSNTSYMLEKHCNLPADLRIALKKNAHEFGRWAIFQLDGAHRFCVTPRKAFVIDEDEVVRALADARRARVERRL